MKALVIIISALMGGAVLSSEIDGFDLQVPKGFPQPEIPTDNQLTKARVELGRRLFFDPMLSLDSTRSCASCHIPSLAFTDGRKVSEGIKGRTVTRNSPSLANMAYMNSFMRDGGVPTLEMQVEAPIQEHNEMDLSLQFVARRMMKNPEYVKMSQLAYEREPDPFVVTRSIAAYERTLISGNSAFDKYSNGNKTAITDDEKAGYEVFKSSECDNCHSGFLFSDQTLKNNGLYLHYPDSGRMRITKVAADRAMFKVPSLRNVAITSPYMHDGSMASLKDVISHYRIGGMAHHNRSELIKPLEISDKEEAQLIAFLRCLTDLEFITDPNIGPN
jgi:cytochrome c peroxidase